MGAAKGDSENDGGISKSPAAPDRGPIWAYRAGAGRIGGAITASGGWTKSPYGENETGRLAIADE